MRIISKFRDYYDGVQTGQDNDLVYVRTEEQVKDKPDEPNGSVKRLLVRFNQLYKSFSTGSKKNPNGSLKPYRTATGRYVSERPANFGCVPVMIFFCGKLHRGVMYYEDWLNKTAYVEKFYWNLLEFRMDFLHDPKRYYSLRRETPIPIGDWFLPLEDSQFTDFSFEHKTPVYTWSVPEPRKEEHIVKDINLGDYFFYRKFDAQSAFQELSMYLGGVMTRSKDPEPLADKHRIVAHGMDETSFRKDPTKIHR